MTSPRTKDIEPERRPIRDYWLSDAIRSIRQHKADFWHYVRLYESEKTPHGKHWYMENLLSQYRMMKSSLAHARELAK